MPFDQSTAPVVPYTAKTHISLPFDKFFIIFRLPLSYIFRETCVTREYMTEVIYYGNIR